MPEWYKEAFDEFYPETYSHRDDGDAVRAVELLGRFVPLKGCLVLDVGCGEGRHLRALSTAGAVAYGVDLSESLLRRQLGKTVSCATLSARGDMRRLPFRDCNFDVCMNMFTSLGYFDKREDELQALQEMKRVLKSYGHVLIDHVNSEWVKENLNPHSVRTSGRLTIEERRNITGDGRTVEKRTVLYDVSSPSSPVRDYMERVTLFGRDELERMLNCVGFETVQIFGSYDGMPFEERGSSRLIFLSRKSA
jgi:ubiquinone/menaquinone biosynthesis C-methylase UbiE